MCTCKMHTTTLHYRYNNIRSASYFILFVLLFAYPVIQYYFFNIFGQKKTLVMGLFFWISAPS